MQPISTRFTSPLLAGLALALSLSAGTTYTITFDAGDPIGGLAVGATLGTQYAASTGATFSSNAFSGAGGPSGSWASNTDMTIVSSTGTDVGGLGTPSLVSGNLLRSFNSWLNENGDPSFLISFANPIDSFSADFAGIATASSPRLFAYNGVNLLSTVISPGTGQQSLSLSGLGLITSIAVTPGDFNDWVGVDNFTFTTVDSSVPEPSTLALSALALAAIAWRRR